MSAVTPHTLNRQKHNPIWSHLLYSMKIRFFTIIQTIKKMSLMVKDIEGIQLEGRSDHFVSI